jgi:hypothetical protein
MFGDIIKFVCSSAEPVGRRNINNRAHARVRARAHTHTHTHTHTQVYAKYSAKVNSYFLDYHGVRHLQGCCSSVYLTACA